MPWIFLIMCLLTTGCARQIPWKSDFTQPPGHDLWRLTDDPREAVGRWLPPPTVAKEGAATRDENDGAIEVANGYWESPALAVEPYAYYRVTLRAKSDASVGWGVMFFASEGKQIVADNYDAMDRPAQWSDDTRYVRAPQGAGRMIMRFHAPTNASVMLTRVSVERASPAEAAAWTQRIYDTLPPMKYTPPADRWALLPATRARLAGGKPLRVVMLGDSICNDTSNSLYEILVAQRWGKHRDGSQPMIQIDTCVRGGTGCDFYAQPGNVKTYVLDHNPDLLIIAGISNGPDADPVRDVIRQVHQARPEIEILVLTGAITPPSFMGGKRKWYPESTRGRSPFDPDPAIIASIREMPAVDASKRVGLQAFSEKMEVVCVEEKVAYLDMRRGWDEYVQSQTNPQEYFLRDPLHGNNRAKQVAGRILADYLSP